MKTSYILYEGPSRLDGAPIVVIATGFKSKTTNIKTGDMIQTWILRQDVKPTIAVKTGQDYSICGDCRHRGTSCYVTVFQAPTNIWKAYVAGKYTHANTSDYQEIFTGRKVRFGAYGDPAAAPLQLWKYIARYAAGHTGYTHQWKDRRNRGYAAFLMASVDAVSEKSDATLRGFRTFRVRTANDDAITEREVVCPASDEAGHLIQCESCMACDGTNSNRRGSIAIIVHGSKAKVNQFQQAA